MTCPRSASRGWLFVPPAPAEPGQTGSGSPGRAEHPPPSRPRALAAFTPVGPSHLPSAAGVAVGLAAGVRGARGGLQEAVPSRQVRGPWAGPGDPPRGGQAPGPPAPAGPPRLRIRLSRRAPPRLLWGAGGTSIEWGSAPQGEDQTRPTGLQLGPATGLRHRSSSLCPHAGRVAPPSFTPGTPTARDGWVGPHSGPPSSEEVCRLQPQLPGL